MSLDNPKIFLWTAAAEEPEVWCSMNTLVDQHTAVPCSCTAASLIMRSSICIHVVCMHAVCMHVVSAARRPVEQQGHDERQHLL